VATTTEVPADTVKVVEVNGERIAICHVDGEFYAISDICTHDGGSLDQGELEYEVIECPRHGAQFNVKTGRVMRLPATEPVDTFPVRVSSTDIEMAVQE